MTLTVEHREQSAGTGGAVVQPPPAGAASIDRLAAPAPSRRRKKTFVERIEAFISWLSTRNNFWHRVCSMIWLPYAFRSGIKMVKDRPGERPDAVPETVGADSSAPQDRYEFEAVLPFRRFNRNWYNAMAGASLLANSEVAGGMYIFRAVGKDYRVVCKELNYRFLRPCFGPAVYKVRPLGDLKALTATGQPFNLDVVLDVYQLLVKAIDDEPEKRVGRCRATFHVMPKAQFKEKKKARAERMEKREEQAGPGSGPAA